MDVRVVIIYSDELKEISVDGRKMDNISSIRHKPIEEWFEESGGRDGWEGLIKEIRNMIDDDEAKLNFEFQGPKESKHTFEEEIAKYGYRVNADGLSADEIAKIHLAEAKKAEHRGLYKKALLHYKDAANYGNSADAAYKAGEYYYNYRRGEENGLDCDMEDAISTAIEYYEKAAEQEHTNAQKRLFEIFYEGTYVKKDTDTALEWLRKIAEKGDTNAQIKCGNILNDEYDEYEEAFKWYKKSADSGNAEGMYMVGECYYYGNGTDEDEEKALEWYKKAADCGNAESMYMVGKCYYYGSGTDVDKEKALKWYKKAAEQGNVDAQYFLGKLYESGNLGEADYNKAEEWYLKAAEQGHARAQFKLGYLYNKGKLGEADYNKAEEWYLKAAEQGNASAQYNLGYLYSHDNLGKADYNKAEKWYLKAADQGDADAQFNLGDLYESGNLGEADYNKAEEWYLKAAEQEHVMAQRNLGYLYASDKLGNADGEKAVEWFKKAADADEPDPDACLVIAESYYQQMIHPTLKSLLKASGLVLLALGIPLTNLITVPAAALRILRKHKHDSTKNKKFLQTDDGKNMIMYYKKAAELGNSKAKERLEKLDID